MCRMIWRSFVILLLFVFLCLNSACLWNDGEPTPIPQGNTLRLLDAGPSTLDPAISQDLSSHIYVVQIFSGLVALDDNLEIVADIAERWEIGQDGKTYTFYLRQDAAFHDGKKITAPDFKYSWERACCPETESPTAPIYLNDIVGVKEMLAGDTETIEGVKVISEHVLEVTINAPKAYFLAKLTYPVAFVVDEAEAESGKKWWRDPNGSGPFKLKDWCQDELILLERNDLYYRDKAKLDYVAFMLWAGAPMQMYERGEIDTTYVSLADLERVMDVSNPLHQELRSTSELSLTYIGFNCTKPPFDDPHMRRAFAHAVDKNRLVSQLLKNAVTPADSILPPGMPGYSAQVKGLDYDLEQAKRLLTEAGYADGKGLAPLTYICPGEGGLVSSWVTSILWQWQQGLGTQIEITQLDFEAYFYHLGDQVDEMFFFAWVADYPDPQNFLEILFHSQSSNNDGGYRNTEVDRLLDQAAVEQDAVVRLYLYQEAEQLILDDAACIPLWFGRNYVLVKPYVKGYSLNPSGIPLLANVSIEK